MGLVLRLGIALVASCGFAAHAHADCIDDAAQYQGVHPSLVRAIALQESGMRAGIISAPNSNGTYDIGLMQINSAWLPTLAQWGITQTKLLDACVNAYVGTWILADNIRRLGPTWNAVGAYNAQSPEKRLVYAQHIYQKLQQVNASGGTLTPISGSPVPSQSHRPTKAARQAQIAKQASLAAFEVGDE